MLQHCVKVVPVPVFAMFYIFFHDCINQLGQEKLNKSSEVYP